MDQVLNNYDFLFELSLTQSERKPIFKEFLIIYDLFCQINLSNISLQSLYLDSLFMLGPSYHYYQDCSGSYVTKKQIAKIHLQSSAKVADSTQIINDNAKHQELYTKGIIYQNQYMHYSLCCLLYQTFGFSTELNKEEISETKVPYFCPCFGPFPVESREKKIGQLRPHGYACQYFILLYPFNHYWTSLSVHDAEMKEIYVVKRVPWTCFMCSKWQIFDQAQKIKSQIIYNGCWCPDIEFNLPNDTEQNKKLVMSVLPHLP